MPQRRRATLEDLRRAVQCLPRHTRVAMLQGINANEIIVGAYANGEGVCPMLAAHRAGGRTAAISFAHAWDRFAFRDGRSRDARRATERELLILRTHLEASLLDEDGRDVPPARGRLAPARDRPMPARDRPMPARDRRAVRPGDPDRAPELRSRPGWAWTRIVRRLDDYERVLSMVEEAAATPVPETLRRSRRGAGT